MKRLVNFLRDQKYKFVRNQDVLVEVYDPTYGLQEPRSETIEVLDFDALLDAIDEFTEGFKHD